jgi:hypothetical protein
MTESNQQFPAVIDTVIPPAAIGFGTAEGLDMIQKAAEQLAKSSLVPDNYHNNIPNCFIALGIAVRMGVSPLMVMQNLYIIKGKPSWSSQFIIAAINSTGKFSPLHFEMRGEGDSRQCTAWALDKATNERVESPPVSMSMAKQEGWSTKKDSKWQSMPEVMLRYRAATFFGRLYVPEILMGIRSYDEVVDIEGEEVPASCVAEKTREKAQELKKRLQEKQAVQEGAVACPNLEGKLIAHSGCAECLFREGCPSHD